MPSILDLSAELQVLIIGYLDTPVALYDPPATYFAPRMSRGVASLSSCCQILRKLAAPTLYRNICLRNDDKSGRSLQAVGHCPWAANFVRELNIEANITLDDEWDEPNPLSDEDFPSSVEDVLTHLERFPHLEILSVHFKAGETQTLDEEAVEDNFDIWMHLSDPYRDFTGLKHKEGRSDWKALMARTYDAISNSERPSALTTLELRNVLPSGISSFTTEAWHTFLRTLKILRLSLHGGAESFNLAEGYLGFVENLDLLFSQLVSVTELRFAASQSGLPGVAGDLYTVFPLHVGDMPVLQVLELQWCFVSERTARFIASHVGTLRRVILKDCYSAATCYNAEEHTTWTTFFNVIANSLGTEKSPVLEEFCVTPGVLGQSRQLGNGVVQDVPISGDDQQIELAQSMSRTDPCRRPFGYATIDDKYGYLREDGEQNLTAFLLGHDQATFDRVTAFIRRQEGRKRRLA